MPSEERNHCAHCAIHILGPFQSKLPNEIESALCHIATYNVPPQASLFIDGEAGESIYAIRRGLLKLVHFLPNGSYRIVRLLRPGDIAGMGALIDRAYRHSAIVMYEAEVCRIPVTTVQQLSKSHTEIYEALMERWHRSLEAAEIYSAELSTGGAEARVARLLLLLDGPTNGQPLPHIRRDDMGALLAISPETTSRIMADFRRRGLIKPVSAEAYDYDRDALAIVARDD